MEQEKQFLDNAVIDYFESLGITESRILNKGRLQAVTAFMNMGYSRSDYFKSYNFSKIDEMVDGIMRAVDTDKLLDEQDNLELLFQVVHTAWV